MSLLTNYEGLRHQIERLVRENEELKKLVRLIRENHELKSAIKTQAGGLGISGFTTGLGEATAGLPSRQSNGVFLPLSPAVANEPVLEEVGIMALTPLAEMLTSLQPSTTPGSLMSPLTGTLSTLLSGPASLSQSSPLTGFLTSPVAGPPTGTLASSLGLPSTGPVAVSQSSPLIAPVTGTVAVSLSSPLLSSTATPLAVSQNLLANPMSNLVLPEAPRLRLAEPLRRGPSGPHSPACMVPAATTKVPLSTEPPRSTQDPEPLSTAFAGTPLQTSTPVGAMGTPAPETAFSFNTSDTQTQPSATQEQVVPVATSYTPSSTTHITQGAPHPPSRMHNSPIRNLPAPHSPPHNPHSPPRTSSSPASVNDSRGPRATEPSRKSMMEVERKLAHHKTSKFPESARGLPEPQ
uniref:Spermatosis and centriole associated 1 n=1 Tax=Rhinopithecus bieti TaxID=61621 RepID=A0A2K6LFC9_RHIBE